MYHQQQYNYYFGGLGVDREAWQQAQNEALDELRTEAATLIQSAWRDYKVRRESLEDEEITISDGGY